VLYKLINKVLSLLIIWETILIKIVVHKAISLLDNSVLNVMPQNTGTQLLKNVLPVNQDTSGILNFIFVIVAHSQNKLLMVNVYAQITRPGQDLNVFAQLEHLVLIVLVVQPQDHGLTIHVFVQSIEPGMDKIASALLAFSDPTVFHAQPQDHG
jgi:hypothetical protein